MDAVLLEVVAIGLTIALSPITVIATILMLLSPQGRMIGPAFLIGWSMGVVSVAIILMQAAGPAGVETANDKTSTWVDVVRLSLGCLLLLAGMLNWRKRRRSVPAALPAWTRMIDRLNPIATVGVGILWGGPSPKNLLLISAAAVSIVEADQLPRQELVEVIALTVAASVGIAIPVLWALQSDESALKRLTVWREWLISYNSTIMAIVLFSAGTLLAAKSLFSLIG